jgi:predicted  nucleic acid-binding Zn-ribbon protein
MCYTALNLDLKEKSILMMSNEEFDRRMEFFLNQQAQFDAEMQKLQESQKELHKTTEATAEGLKELRTLVYEGFKISAERFEVVSRNFEVVSEKFNHIDALFSNTDAKISALIDSQIQTEKLVRNIGVKLDRHLNEDHNGRRNPNTS